MQAQENLKNQLIQDLFGQYCFVFKMESSGNLENNFKCEICEKTFQQIREKTNTLEMFMERSEILLAMYATKYLEERTR